MKEERLCGRNLFFLHVEPLIIKIKIEIEKYKNLRKKAINKTNLNPKKAINLYFNNKVSKMVQCRNDLKKTSKSIRIALWLDDNEKKIYTLMEEKKDVDDSHLALRERYEVSISDDEYSISDDEDSISDDEDSISDDEDSISDDEDSISDDEDSISDDEDSISDDEDCISMNMNALMNTSSFNNFLDGPPPKKLKPGTFTIASEPAKLTSIQVKKALKIPKNHQILIEARRILKDDKWEYKNATIEDCCYLVDKVDAAIKYVKLKNLKKELDEIQKKQLKLLSQHYYEGFKNIKKLKLPKKMYKKTEIRFRKEGKEIPHKWYYPIGHPGHRNVSAGIKLYVKHLRGDLM